MILAYLDAGSGSLLVQALLGGAAGIAVAFKAWKARLLSKQAVAEAVTEAETEAEVDESSVTSDP